MPKDRMTPDERLVAVTSLKEPPDRVPVAPMIYYFAAQVAGITVAELMSSYDTYRRAINQCWDELGPWDIYYNIAVPNKLLYTFVLPMKIMIPGVDLPDDSVTQFVEEEVMSREDYKWLVETKMPPFQKYFAFMMRISANIHPEITDDDAGRAKIMEAMQDNQGTVNTRSEWRERGIAFLNGGGGEMPFDMFSMSRSFEPFIFDCHEDPDLVREATMELTKGFIEFQIAMNSASGIPRALLFCHRTSNDFISPKQFERDALPSMKLVAESLVEKGIKPVFHCDGDWDRNLEMLLELPKGQCIIQFDGRTDVFLAKEVIGKHHCIFGDVPATLLAMGSEAETDEYCKKMIEVVGKDGGFVMGAGCEIPHNAKPANVKAMIDSVKKYGYYD